MGVEDPPSIGIWLSNKMDIFNIPELHLMLGVGKKLNDAILVTMSEEKILTHENLNGVRTMEMHLREMQ